MVLKTRVDVFVYLVVLDLALQPDLLTQMLHVYTLALVLIVNTRILYSVHCASSVIMLLKQRKSNV